MEHLNRLCKTDIEGLGANKSQKAIIKVGKTVGIVDELLIRRIVLHLSVMLIQQSLWLGTSTWLLKSYMTFKHSMYYKKVHTSFKTMSTNLIRTLDGGTVKERMVKNMAKLL